MFFQVRFKIVAFSLKTLLKMYSMLIFHSIESWKINCKVFCLNFRMIFRLYIVIFTFYGHIIINICSANIGTRVHPRAGASPPRPHPLRFPTDVVAFCCSQPCLSYVKLKHIASSQGFANKNIYTRQKYTLRNNRQCTETSTWILKYVTKPVPITMYVKSAEINTIKVL